MSPPLGLLGGLSLLMHRKPWTNAQRKGSTPQTDEPSEAAQAGIKGLYMGLCCHRVATLLYDMLWILTNQKGRVWSGLVTGDCFGEGGALGTAGVLGVRVFVSRGAEPWCGLM